MPNFKLGEHYKQVITQGANNALHNYVTGFTNNFPLTHEEVQACVISRELLSQFEMLWAAGARTISRSQGVACFLDREATEGLRRHCVLQLRTKHDEGFFTDKAANPYIGSPMTSARDRSNLIHLNLRSLPRERAQAVIEWCHLLVRAIRLRDMTQTTVQRALVWMASTANLMATWPELATFAKEDATLRKRFAAPPQKLEKYKVGEFNLPPKKQREAANVVLTMGSMSLPASKNEDEAEVRGAMPIFEKLPADPVF